MTADFRTSVLRWIEFLQMPFLMGLICVLPFESHSALFMSLTLYGSLVLVAAKLLIKGRAGLVSTPIDLPIFALMLVVVASTIFSVDALISLKSMRHNLVGFILVYYIVIYAVDSVAKVKKLLFTFVLFSVIPSIYGLWTLASGSGLLDERVRSTFRHPNRFANYMVLVIPLAFCLARHYRKNIFIRLTLSAIFCVCTAALILAASRGATLGLLLGFLIVFGLRSKAVWITAGVVVALIVILSPFQRADLRLMKGAYLLGGQLSAERVLGERLLLWESGVNIVKDHPLLGIGYGKTLPLVYLTQYANSSATEEQTQTHNTPLQVAVELGLLGLCVFIWLHIVVFKETWHAAKRDEALNDAGILRASSTGALIALLGMMGTGMFNYFYKDRLILVYWLIIGLAFSLRRLSNMRASTAKS